tara:strand:- start:53 stop:199 length:147 start_codon:yes stop_codon:yes gene_type:complete
MEYTTLREPKQVRKTPQRKTASQCPSGFRWDSKKGKCVQAGVGPEYKP